MGGWENEQKSMAGVSTTNELLMNVKLVDGNACSKLLWGVVVRTPEYFFSNFSPKKSIAAKILP
jgi:hypothetical protein